MQFLGYFLLLSYINSCKAYDYELRISSRRSQCSDRIIQIGNKFYNITDPFSIESVIDYNENLSKWIGLENIPDMVDLPRQEFSTVVDTLIVEDTNQASEIYYVTVLVLSRTPSTILPLFINIAWFFAWTERLSISNGIFCVFTLLLNVKHGLFYNIAAQNNTEI